VYSEPLEQEKKTDLVRQTTNTKEALSAVKQSFSRKDVRSVKEEKGRLF